MRTALGTLAIALICLVGLAAPRPALAQAAAALEIQAPAPPPSDADRARRGLAIFGQGLVMSCVGGAAIGALAGVAFVGADPLSLAVLFCGFSAAAYAAATVAGAVYAGFFGLY